MEKPKWDDEMRFRVILGSVFLAGVLLLFSDAIVYELLRRHINDVWKELFAGLAHALIIASVLGATVDVYAKKKLVEEANQLVHKASKDIAEYVAGFPLPPKMRPKILEILGSRVIACNGHIHYKIVPSSTQPDKITLDVDYTYSIRNLGASSDKYRQKLWFEKHAKPAVHEISFISADGQKGYRISNPELIEKEQGELIVLGPEVELQPDRDDLIYEFRAQYSYNFPVEYNEYFFFTRPMIDFTVTVDCPPEFEFFAPKTTVCSEVKWVYQRAFLTNEQLGVRWRQKAAVESTGEGGM